MSPVEPTSGGQFSARVQDKIAAIRAEVNAANRRLSIYLEGVIEGLGIDPSDPTVNVVVKSDPAGRWVGYEIVPKAEPKPDQELVEPE